MENGCGLRRFYGINPAELLLVKKVLEGIRIEDLAKAIQFRNLDRESWAEKDC